MGSKNVLKTDLANVNTKIINLFVTYLWDDKGVYVLSESQSGKSFMGGLGTESLIRYLMWLDGYANKFVKDLKWEIPDYKNQNTQLWKFISRNNAGLLNNPLYDNTIKTLLMYEWMQKQKK